MRLSEPAHFLSAGVFLAIIRLSHLQGLPLTAVLLIKLIAQISIRATRHKTKPTAASLQVGRQGLGRMPCLWDARGWKELAAPEGTAGCLLLTIQLRGNEKWHALSLKGKNPSAPASWRLHTDLAPPRKILIIRAGTCTLCALRMDAYLHSMVVFYCATKMHSS